MLEYPMKQGYQQYKKQLYLEMEKGLVIIFPMSP